MDVVVGQLFLDLFSVATWADSSVVNQASRVFLVFGDSPFSVIMYLVVESAFSVVVLFPFLGMRDLSGVAVLASAIARKF